MQKNTTQQDGHRATICRNILYKHCLVSKICIYINTNLIILVLDIYTVHQQRSYGGGRYRDKSPSQNFFFHSICMFSRYIISLSIDQGWPDCLSRAACGSRHSRKWLLAHVIIFRKKNTD